MDDEEEVMAEETSCWSLEVIVAVVVVFVVVVVVGVETETLLASPHPQPKEKHRNFFFGVGGVAGCISAVMVTAVVVSENGFGFR